MQQENKILLSAVLVLGVAMLSSSFLNLTGNIVNCKESIATAIPNEINLGDSVTVNVGSGKGFYEEARVYKRNLDRNGKAVDSKISVTMRNICGGEYKCKSGSSKIQTYSQSDVWESNQDYVIKLKDVCTGDFTIEAPFRIR
ncbi:hypothetical protein HYV88_00155 [Candidatus Woesearchaeota archaeon]|nr:hypothetical protein [Candidatus Woesearchaeota archaeon]